jgi:protein-L-isoaspartate(D-aspartate) O-methyltransferase
LDKARITEILDFKILIMNLDKIFEEWQNNNYKIMEKIKRKVKNEKIIEAFLKVPRNLFVENEPFEDIAVYYDLGQTSSQPSLIAEMLELLEIKKDDKVLEIGTGSGYLTALLCELSYFVYSIDIFQEFIIRADEKLKLLNYKNYKLFVRDGNYGLEEFSPYDKIIVSAYVENIPISLLEQLNLEGIMVIPVGKKNFQHLYKIIKYEAVSFVPLLNTLKF